MIIASASEEKQRLRYEELCHSLNERAQDERMHGGQIETLVEQLADECGCGPNQGRSDGGAHFASICNARGNLVVLLRHEDHEQPTVIYVRTRNAGSWMEPNRPYLWRLYS